MPLVLAVMVTASFARVVPTASIASVTVPVCTGASMTGTAIGPPRGATAPSAWNGA